MGGPRVTTRATLKTTTKTHNEQVGGAGVLSRGEGLQGFESPPPHH